jgi:hypothetical protein
LLAFSSSINFAISLSKTAPETASERPLKSKGSPLVYNLIRFKVILEGAGLDWWF